MADINADAKPPVIVYAPGLLENAWNTADRVAEVLARALDNRVEGSKYSSRADATVTAPRGLRVSHTIVDGDNTKVFQVFELDYRPRFERSSNSSQLPSAAIGLLTTSRYLIRGLFLLLAAIRRRQKSTMAKFQIGIGYALVLTLIFAWLIALYALCEAAFTLPAWLSLDGVFGTQQTPTYVGLSFGAVSLITWQLARTHIVNLALTTQRLLDYTENQDGRRDTVCMAVDDAIAGLLDDGYKEIHLVGYSFGSLIIFDAVLPQESSLRSATPVDSIASVTTIGCPIDMARTFHPAYMAGRKDRRPPGSGRWLNIFNAADVFGSNLMDRSDEAESSRAEFEAKSVRYLNERLTLLRVFTGRGFRAHAHYWSEADEAHCFEPLVLHVQGTSGTAEQNEDIKPVNSPSTDTVPVSVRGGNGTPARFVATARAAMAAGRVAWAGQ